MGTFRTLLVLVVSALIFNQANGQNLCASNPSFEGPSQAHVVPAPWSNCGGSPDTQPGQWGITQAPSDGTSYVSFLQSGSSPGGYFEGASQVLSSCMVAGETYTINMDLAHSNTYNTAGPGNCYSSFAIYGGNSLCAETELLGQTGPIFNTAWQTFTFTWTATGNWCYITFRPEFITACSGFINVLVDNFGCVTVVGSVVTTTDASCFGICDGTASATPVGGTPPYTYNWSNGGTSSSISGLCIGIYDLTITDATGATDVQSGTVNEPVALTAPVVATNVSCLGGNNGSASVTPAGGTPGYTYGWSSGGTTTSVSGLIQGAYDVTVTDSNGCQVITPFTILDGGIVTATISATTDVSCFGGTNGTASVLVTDGVPAYTYLWCNGQTTPTVTSLPAGACAVTITDANGCTTSVSATINEPAVLSANIGASTPATCFGLCDGTATASASGGTAPYAYLWGDGQTTITAANLCVGTITLDITDVNGCIASTSALITEPPLLALVTTSIDPGCMDSCDGSATVVATGGIPPYTFSWNDPNTQSTTTATGLCDGAYVITVADANGCIAVATAVLVDPPQLIATIASTTNVTCFGNCNGLAQVSVTGGGLPYTYLWSSGDTSSQAIALCAGTYDVTVNNINGCRSIATTPITEPPLLDFVIIDTSVSCFGACDGNAMANVTGGVQPYTYLWDDGLLQTTQTASNLCSAPGGVAYTVIVSDNNGCSVTKSVVITQPTQLGLIQSIVQPTTCGSNNGSACVNGTGGVTPYTYLWNDGLSTTDSCLTGVFAGPFDVTVTDFMGCQFNMPVLINDIAGPAITSITTTPLMCFGDNNSSATVSFTGGTPSFTFSWLDGTGAVIATGSTVIFNLVADNYSVIIEDGNQCIEADTFSITQPSQLASAISTFSDASCAGTCDGSATVIVNGGTPTYTYVWTSGGAAATDAALCAGTHNVFVMDANGCTSQSSQVISEPVPLAVTFISNDVLCNGDTNGDISLNVTGGTGIYTYNWIQGGQTSSFLTGLTAGTYDVDVTDAQGCVVSETIVITEPPVLLASALAVPSTCGNSNGTATVTPTGGTQPWAYVWSPGGFQTTATATGLVAGTYSVTVTDVNNCTFVLSGFPVSDIPGPTIDSVVMQDVQCFGDATGSGIVYITPGSGTVPISYLWGDGQTTSSATGFSMGQTSILVSDLNSCDTTVTVTVNEPTELIASILPINQICVGEQATLDASSSGGMQPATFNWATLGAGASQIVSPSTTTSYTVTATDANGCTDDETIQIVVRPPITLTLPPETICDGENIDLIVGATGGLGSNYTYQWSSNASSSTSVANVSPVLANPAPAPPFSVTYDVTVSDGCSDPAFISTTVTINPAPVALIIDECSPNPFEYQFRDNSNISSGSIVSYAWDFGDTASGADNFSMSPLTTHDFSPGAGNPFVTVSLTVTSDLGCSDTISAIIIPPPIANFNVDPLETSSLSPTFDITDSSFTTDPFTSYSWTFGDGIFAGPGPEAGTISGVDFTGGTYQALSHIYQDTGIYYITLTVTDPTKGCSDSIGQYVRINADYIFWAPNSFIPSSFIEANRTFRPKIIGMGDDEFEIYIYDRWGDKVYEFIGNYNTWKGWDGVVNDGKKIAQTDVYVWLIRTEDLNQETHEYVGHLTLIH